MIVVDANCINVIHSGHSKWSQVYKDYPKQRPKLAMWAMARQGKARQGGTDGQAGRIFSTSLQHVSVCVSIPEHMQLCYVLQKKTSLACLAHAQKGQISDSYVTSTGHE